MIKGLGAKAPKPLPETTPMSDVVRRRNDVDSHDDDVNDDVGVSAWRGRRCIVVGWQVQMGGVGDVAVAHAGGGPERRDLRDCSRTATD